MITSVSNYGTKLHADFTVSPENGDCTLTGHKMSTGNFTLNPNMTYRPIAHSENGAALCESILQNDSLLDIDVRNCMLTSDEMSLIMHTVHERTPSNTTM
uniref:Uncharacterized protein n=1 Tax=Lygus hesperus TaxID=30085 RepID=A0A146KM76_LYGHE